MVPLGETSRWGVRMAGVLLALLVGAALMLPAAASANWTPYWSGWSGTSRHGDVTRTTLTMSSAQSYSCGSCAVWAGAHYSGGLTLYASWATGNGYACHNYGTNNIGAMFETPYTSQNMDGRSGWVGDQGGFYC